MIKAFLIVIIAYVLAGLAAVGKEDERVVLLNTGISLKYPDAVHITVPVLQPQDAVPHRAEP